jgi:hypothetical protein
MKKALVATNESRQTGYRVAQVVNSEAETFDTSDALIWVDCPDDLEADQKWFDPSDNTFKDFPPIEPAKQPSTSGTQTI